MASCIDKMRSSDDASQNSSSDTLIPYNLSKADSMWWLPHELQEISGIELISDTTIACIQDEKGFIFIYDLKNKSIISKTQFAKKGDYEDLAYINQWAWILKSNGTLFRFDTKNPDREGEKIKTGLSKDLDFEGLEYDENRNTLLLAPKQSRFIYVFDISSMNISDSIYVKSTMSNKLKTSALAFHPNESKLYILSSVHKSLIILDKDYSILGNIKLDAKTFKQPEGMCFAEDGTLFISNEGMQGKSNILRFNKLYDQ